MLAGPPPPPSPRNRDAPRSVRTNLTPRDWILLLIQLFLIGFVATRWTDYQCSVPLNVWLVASYGSSILYRLSQFLAQYYASGDENDWTTHYLPLKFVWINHWIVFQFMLVWSIIGCVWYRSDHDCLPASIGSWGFIFTLVLLLIYIFQHLSMSLRCLSVYAATRREIENDTGCLKYIPGGLARLHQLLFAHIRRMEIMARGGDQGNVLVIQRPILISFQRPIQVQPAPNPGLTPAQIAELPTRHLTAKERMDELCSICLVEFPQLPPTKAPPAADGSSSSMNATTEPEVSRLGAPPSRVYSSDPIPVRVLSCTHVFHQECLDSWLKEKRLCPNCRVRIGPPVEDDPPRPRPIEMGVEEEIPVLQQAAFAWHLQLIEHQQRQMQAAEHHHQQQQGEEEPSQVSMEHRRDIPPELAFHARGLSDEDSMERDRIQSSHFPGDD